MIKSPHQFEFQNIVEFLDEELKEAQLQEVLCTGKGLVLGFYRFHRKPHGMYLVFDLDNQFPFVGLFETNPWSRLKTSKPMGLFISSHFKHCRLESIKVLSNFGRVLEITFSGVPQKLQFILIPKQPNLIAYASDKSVSWNKPKPLEPTNINQEWAQDLESRSIPFLFNQWWDFNSKGKTHEKVSQKSSNEIPSYNQWIKKMEGLLNKKKKALEQIDEKLNSDIATKLKSWGELLKTNDMQSLPIEAEPWIDRTKNLSWNRNILFSKAKSLEDKIKGTLERKSVLLKEINELEEKSEDLYQKELQKLSEKKVYQSQRKKSDGDFRKKVLNEEINLYCLMGKSAVDNLKLLRQAKSWDLWLHLKDYPSAYAIVFKQRGQSVSDQALFKAAHWLAEQSLKKSEIQSGQKISVVVVECRHVRPIKGDKIGRVTYHHPREFLISL